MHFNGGYNCSGGGDSISCSLSCPSGVSFNTPPAKLYTCYYKDAKFLPQPIPQCVFEDGVEVFHSQHSESVYTIYGQRIVSNPGVFMMYYSQNVDLTRKPKKGLCMTWNGNKVKTFDGMIYSSSLHCSHTLLHDKVDGLFSVILRNCPYGETKCNVAVIVYLSNIKYTFENDNGVIKFYTVKAQLPIPSQMPGIRVNLVGGDLNVELEVIQTTITWDGKKFLGIEVNSAMWNRTAGLCGSFDGDFSNDFASKDGSIHTTARTAVDAWQAPTVDLDPSKCIMGDSTEFDEKECDPATKLRATGICEQLVKNQKFHSCAEKFNAEMLIKSCVADFCFCHNKQNPTACACRGIDVLAKDCSSTWEVNFEDGWRNTEICGE